MVRGRERDRVTPDEYHALLARKKQVEGKLKEARRRMTDARQQGVQDSNDQVQAGMEFRQTQHLFDQISSRILSAEIIYPQTASHAADVMRAGRTVEVLRDGNKETITLTETLMSTSPRGTVSLKSPLGTALNGMKEGEEKTFQTPRGLSTVRILTLAS